MLTEHLPILHVLIPLVGAIVVLAGGVLCPVRQGAWGLTFLVVLASGGCATLLVPPVLEQGRVSYALGNWAPPYGIEYAVDSLSLLLILLITGLASLITLYTKRSIQRDIAPNLHPYFYSAYLLFLGGLLGMVTTADLFNLYVFLEIASLAGYALIAVGRRREALLASYNYLIIGTIASTIFLLGVGYLYMITGTLNMPDLRLRLAELYGSRTLLVGMAFITLGLSVKMALFPLHTWLPNAYTYAPDAVTALMASLTTKVGVYTTFRVFFGVLKPSFLSQVVPLEEIFMFLGASAIIAGSLMAIFQQNLKRMLAYSSVAQIGYMVLGLAMLNIPGMMGGVIHIVNHAVIKAGLFLAVGNLIYRTGAEQIEELNQVARRMPLTMVAFTLCALALIGVPLTAGFVTKWYLILGSIEAGRWFIVPVVVVGALLAAVYLWRVIERAYFYKESVKPHPQPRSASREEVNEYLTPPAPLSASREGESIPHPQPLSAGREGANEYLTPPAPLSAGREGANEYLTPPTPLSASREGESIPHSQPLAAGREGESISHPQPLAAGREGGVEPPTSP
ncbi:MAG: monovalent cation/H+ antiporter subunit D family protein, partial [Fimbriimonadales bacterium]